MTIQFTELAQRIAASRAIAPDDLMALRREGWGDGRITRGEAEALFAINRSLGGADAQWVDFFTEALREFVLNGSEPRGMCDEQEASWLIDQIDADGRLETMAELELAVSVLEKSRNVPDSLKHYVLEQVERAVLFGKGPTRDGGALSDTHITTAECAIIRRVIFASGGIAAAAVSRFDAEMLFRIKDATLGCDNAPQWQPLFVDGIVNYLRGFTLPVAQISHARMKELESFIADNRTSVGGFLGRMARETPQVYNHFGKVFGRKQSSESYEGRQAAGEQITDNERNWLDSMIDANGEVDELDRAVLEELAQDL
ncbi:hypothetical protein GRI58_04470 [Porphyrobacter algicida]|uniref:Uncharacterized protein n=1 Tax=Qipengyuania algicida TaxID=1836209 RepID=A0A845AHP3_9SPHN|nr:hypothetical protein [Qipengyuania algicida]MXP28076.1 hypothetical protein [Qipengyuania algicida]